MKKILAVMTAVAMILTSVSCSKKSSANSDGSRQNFGNNSEFKVAMITDYGDITDESFNQISYEASKEFCEDRAIPFKYYKPATNSEADRINAAEQAIAEGANILVAPGYAMAGMTVEISKNYPDVKIIALDVSEGDLLAAAVPNYDYDPSKYNVGDYYNKDSVFCAVYKEELSGYMAGYAAVKMGYKHLGFLGGMAVPAVIRFGYGYVQGINDAAKELGVEGDVSVEYVYGNQFYGDADITAYTDSWVLNGGIDVIFACGGGIFTSACESAKKVSGVKMIGVDVDQKKTIDAYAENLTITSAMKGLAATVKTVLGAITEGKWSDYAGKISSLGIVSENPEENYVQLPSSTTWTENFTENDYKALVKNLYDGTVKVSDAIDSEPVTSVKVNYLGNIK